MLTNLCFLHSGQPLGSRCTAIILEKNKHFSMSGSKEMDCCSDVKNTRKRHHRGLQFSPINFTWQVVTGETRIHSQLAHSALCIHREQLVTQKQSFCKTQELNLDSVTNVEFQEKSINPWEQPSKHVMEWVKVHLPSKPIVLLYLFWEEI